MSTMAPADESQRAEQAWLYQEHVQLWRGSDDPIDINWTRRAVRHLAIRTRLSHGRTPVGGPEHLDDLDYTVWRDGFAGEVLDYYRGLELDEILRDAGTTRDRAAAAGVSKSTEYRRRKASGNVRVRKQPQTN